MLTGRGAIIDRMVRAKCGTYKEFCLKYRVRKISLESAIYRNIVNESVIRALERAYGGDYSWLEKEDGRCTQSTRLKLKN